MNQQLQNDLTHIGSLLDAVKHQGLDFLAQLPNRATSTKTTVQTIDTLNEEGLGGLETLAHFNQKFEKLIVGSAGPRYWGYMIGGVTPAALMGDWLTSVFDPNPQPLKGHGDLSANIEVETVKLLLNLFNLPSDFLGGFVTGATLSNFTCLGVARQWIGKELGKDFAKEGVSGNIQILTAVPHSSSIKSLSMLGIGSNNFKKIKVAEGNRESLDIDELETAIQELNGQPFILISSAGTVNTVDFDDLQALAKLKEKYNFWWHVDAAFGAFAACSPKYKHLVSGWENADSITIDCHKWLNVPYESAVFLVKEKYKTLQIETFQNANAPYLGNAFDNFNYLNLLPENSRRLKALPAWFTLKAYGKKGYREIVEHSVELANILGKFIAESEAFELLAPVRLHNVCFTVRGDQEQVFPFLAKLNETEKVFMTPTVYQNKRAIRASFVNWRTTKEDVEIAINEMKKIAISSMPPGVAHTMAVNS